MAPTMSQLPPDLRKYVAGELGRVERIVNQLRNTVQYRDDAAVTEIFERSVEASLKLSTLLVDITKGADL